jgi:hypothetical protein
MGPRHQSYGSWSEAPNVGQLNNPHFLAGALILPPTRPGWKNAAVNEISDLIDQNLETAESLYQSFKAEAPHLGAEEWESLMIRVLKSYTATK